MRKQMTLIILLGGLVLLSLSMPSPSRAQPGRFGDGPGPHGFPPSPPDHLDRPDQLGPPGHARPLGRHGYKRGPRGQRGPGGPPSRRFIERHAERLGIDEDTQSSIRAIVDGSHTTGREIRQSLDQAEQEMRGLLQQETPDKDAVLHQAEKIGMLRIKEQQNRLQAMLQIRALLTPEQRQAINQLRKDDRPHRRRRGRRRRHGQLFRACQENVAQLCPDAEPGRSSIQCLTDNWDALSDECHAFFERGSERGSRSHGHPGKRAGDDSSD